MKFMMLNYDRMLNIWIELGTKDDQKRIVMVDIARNLSDIMSGQRLYHFRNGFYFLNNIYID